MRWLLLLFLVGCARTLPPVEAPQRLPISDSVENLIVMPEHKGPAEGKAVGLSVGDEAPFDGILLDEIKAFGSAELRIAYDDLYRLSEIQRSAYLVSLRIMEQELQQADREIAEKNAALREIRDSWWGKHKGVIMIGVGVIIGGCAAIGAGAVWSKIDE